MDVRAAARNDWPRLRPLVEEMGFVEDRSRLQHRFESVVDDPTHGLFVAVQDRDVLGYTWSQDFGPHLRSGRSTVRMHDLFVRPDARLSGVGRSLFDAARAWAAKRDASWLQWHGGSESREFYARLGIEPIAEDPNQPSYEIVFKHPAG